MQSGWEKSEYQIQVHQASQIRSETVYGIEKGGFGVHESGKGWNITHIASGWKCFTVMSRIGAVVIAHYLIRNYTPDFERLKVSGTTLENFKPLENKIKSDSELKELVRLFGIENETDGKKVFREVGVKIIS